MILGIPYDSDKGREIAAAITALMTGESYDTSAEMASFLGAFPEFEKNREHMLRVIRNHRRAAYNAKPEEYEKLNTIPVGIDHKVCPQYLLNAAIESWDRALLLGENYGYRNAQTTLIAPTGTISFVMDADTTGIEPDFALVKFKKLYGGGYFKIVNRSVIPALRNLGYDEGQVNDIIKYMIGTNTLKGAPYINDLVLKKKGFTNEDIQKIEKLLPGIFESSLYSTFIL
jgi:ribonucleoside-diphosphate reductase alpha chain